MDSRYRTISPPQGQTRNITKYNTLSHPLPNPPSLHNLFFLTSTADIVDQVLAALLRLMMVWVNR